MVTFKKKWTAMGKAARVWRQSLLEKEASSNEDTVCSDEIHKFANEIVEQVLTYAESDITWRMKKFAISRNFLEPQSVKCCLRIWNVGMAYVNEQNVVFGNYSKTEYEEIAELIKAKIEEQGGVVKKRKVSFKRNDNQYVKLDIVFKLDF